MIDLVNHAAEKCLANCRLSASDVTKNATSNGKNIEPSNSLSRGDKANLPKSLCLDSLMSSRAPALCQECSPDRDIHNNLFPVIILCCLMEAVALNLFMVILTGADLPPGHLSWPEKLIIFCLVKSGWNLVTSRKVTAKYVGRAIHICRQMG